jgi:hypothetical protein
MGYEMEIEHLREDVIVRGTFVNLTAHPAEAQ